jgi:hypothetical protein
MAAPASPSGVQGLKAAAVIAVLVIVGIVVLARSNGGHPKISAASTSSRSTTTTTRTQATIPAPTTTTTVLPASQVKVQVLNGVGSGSLSGAWSNKLKTTHGYITEAPDDATAKVTSSEIYILTPGYGAEANALAAAVGLSSAHINSTVPPPATAPIPKSELSTANLVLVIGPDLASSA